MKALIYLFFADLLGIASVYFLSINYLLLGNGLGFFSMLAIFLPMIIDVDFLC